MKTSYIIVKYTYVEFRKTANYLEKQLAILLRNSINGFFLFLLQSADRLLERLLHLRKLLFCLLQQFLLQLFCLEIRYWTKYDVFQGVTGTAFLFRSGKNIPMLITSFFEIKLFFMLCFINLLP